MVLLFNFDFDDMRRRIARLLKHNPMSQAQMAREIGFLNQPQFTKFMKGKHDLQTKNAFMVEKYLEKKEKEYGIESNGVQERNGTLS